MIRFIVASGAALAVSSPAWADPEFLGGQLRGRLDVRAIAADGERSFTESGFGKTRGSGNDGDADAQAELGNAALVWRRDVAWNLRGYLHLQAMPGQERGVDAVEAYLTYKPMPIGETHMKVRAGLMYPPVSLEHDGLAWTPTSTITPSAVNTWIGEEVLVAGVEGSARRSFAGQQLGATIALFGYNDTSGTLLSYRGWAMHDLLITAKGAFPLPRQSAAWHIRKANQSMNTEPVRELDDRVGYYARLDWAPADGFAVNAFHYDNAGDRDSVEDGQWSWETRFTNLGLEAQLSENTKLLAQAMSGETIYGMNTPVGYWTELSFSAAYVLIAHDMGPHRIAARVDAFETTDTSNPVPDNNNEDGWALTGAYRVAVNPHVSLAFEGLHMESDRPAREGVGLSSEQSQTTLQSALQLSF